MSQTSEKKHAEQMSTLCLGMVKTSCFQLTREFKDGVITVKGTASAISAIRTLCENNIRAAPVVDKDGKYLGMVSMMRLLSCCLNVFDKGKQEPSAETIQELKRVFSDKTVSDIISYHPLPRYCVIHQDHSLLHALEVMKVTGEHRLAIVNHDEIVTGIITQSMVCRWFLDNIEHLPKSLLDTKCSDIRQYNLLATLPVSNKAIDAFRLIHTKHLGGCAVVDSKGDLVEVMSSRDLKGINPDSLVFKSLWDDIATFKDQVRQSYPDVPASPVTVAPNDSFEHILKTMMQKRLHRVFVVAEESRGSRKVVDCVSLVDLVTFVLDTITA